MPSSSGNRVFSHPETCSGEQSKLSLLATILCPLQLPVDGQQAQLWAQRRFPGVVVCLGSSIPRRAAVARELPAHRQRRSAEALGCPANRPTRSDATGTVLALSQRERYTRAPTDRRNYPIAVGQQIVNRRVIPAERPSDLAHRLPGFPSVPQLTLLRRRKPWSSHLCHTHHLPGEHYRRWCCPDPLRPPSNFRD